MKYIVASIINGWENRSRTDWVQVPPAMAKKYLYIKENIVLFIILFYLYMKNNE
jgi:hypothetical protein